MKLPSRHPVRLLAVLVAALLVASLWVLVDHGASGYYAFAPGSAPTITSSPLCRASSGGDLALPGGKPCVHLGVPADKAHAIDGSLYMVDVLVGQATPAQYILDKLGLLHTLLDGTQLIPARDVLGTTPPSQLSCQDTQQMAGATSSAAVVALRRLGYSVRENDLGAQVDEVVPGSPADAAGMRCNDLITRLNGTPIRTAEDLRTAIHAAKPGQTISVTVRRTTGGKTTSLTLHPTVQATPPSERQGAQANAAFLGVAVQSRVTYSFPFHVTIDVGSIGGPSAGLALTLGVLDVLSNGRLTGGHSVAATGTISTDGTVGDVGGVAQKTIAVRRAGAQVFLVPRQELAVARSRAGAMKVYAVATLGQALGVLKSLGGEIPAPPGLRSAGA